MIHSTLGFVMTSRSFRLETRSRARDEIKRIMQTVEKVRKWEKKWVDLGLSNTLKVYKWVPVREENNKEEDDEKENEPMELTEEQLPQTPVNRRQSSSEAILPEILPSPAMMREAVRLDTHLAIGSDHAPPELLLGSEEGGREGGGRGGEGGPRSAALSLPAVIDSGAAMSGAVVSGTAVSGAAVSGATVSGTAVSGAAMSGATVSGATMSGAVVSGDDMFGDDVSGAAVSSDTVANIGDVIGGRETADGLSVGVAFAVGVASGVGVGGGVTGDAASDGVMSDGAGVSGEGVTGADEMMEAIGEVGMRVEMLELPQAELSEDIFDDSASSPSSDNVVPNQARPSDVTYNAAPDNQACPGNVGGANVPVEGIDSTFSRSIAADLGGQETASTDSNLELQSLPVLESGATINTTQAVVSTSATSLEWEEEGEDEAATSLPRDQVASWGDVGEHDGGAAVRAEASGDPPASMASADTMQIEPVPPKPPQEAHDRDKRLDRPRSREERERGRSASPPSTDSGRQKTRSRSRSPHS